MTIGETVTPCSVAYRAKTILWSLVRWLLAIFDDYNQIQDVQCRVHVRNLIAIQTATTTTTTAT
eukprot:672042-Amphidinium_carterae.2